MTRDELLSNAPQLASALATALTDRPQYLDASIHANTLAFSLTSQRVYLEQLIMALDLVPNQAGVTAAAGARAQWWNSFGATHWADHQPIAITDPSPDRPLRIGYVSGDMCAHSCAMMFGSIAREHSEAIRPFLYSSTPHNVYDEATVCLRESSNITWRDVVAFTDQALAAKIRADAIDILVDCSGYTPNNRLTVFAMKPAPIQVSAWGYVMPLGWPTGVIDAMFVDDVLEDADGSPTEALVRLPCLAGHCCTVLPPIKQRQRDHPVFGAFHQARKLNPAVLELWRHLLDLMPTAELVFKGSYSADVRQWIAEWLPTSRVSFRPITNHIDHLDAYNDIDVTLDTFPQNGCVTTIEGLLMGVPSITIMGPTMIQRATSSILTAVGLSNTIATTEQHYLHVAEVFREGPISLILRQQLRAQTTLRLFDGYTAAVESAFRGLWTRKLTSVSEGVPCVA